MSSLWLTGSLHVLVGGSKVVEQEPPLCKAVGKIPPFS